VNPVKLVGLLLVVAVVAGWVGWFIGYADAWDRWVAAERDAAHWRAVVDAMRRRE
jgi:hypothetical protein